MKRRPSPMSAIGKILTLAVLWAAMAAHAEITPEEAANTVNLTETGEKNLKIQTVEAEETDFEETAFALGRIEAIPEKRAVVASRIPGRVMELKTTLGTLVEAGAEVVRLESRQPGDPPPSIWLKAPATGLVTENAVRLGEPVEPDRALVEITDLREVYAVARVPEHLAGRLKAGAVAHLRVAALGGEELEGTLLRFGTAADRASGTIDAVFALPNADLALRPGMRAEFSIVLGKREGVMSVPRIALQGDHLNRSVFRRHYDKLLKHSFVRIPVEVGAMNDRFVEILSGLAPGDEVVTTGAYSLGFSGNGAVSMKEVLDAVHGHEHNEDGSEMTAEQKAREAAAKSGAQGDARGGFSMLTLFSLIGNGLLLLLLVAAGARKPKAEAS